MHNQNFGAWGEQAALWWFKRQGYREVTTHFRPYMAEIDLIVENDEEILFIEVKTRNTSRFGRAHTALSKRKRQKKHRAIYFFISKHKYFIGDRKCRFLVLAINKEGDKCVFTCLRE